MTIESIKNEQMLLCHWLSIAMNHLYEDEETDSGLFEIKFDISRAAFLKKCLTSETLWNGLSIFQP